MKIIKFSQSTFIFESKKGKRLLIDPGKYNFDKDFKPEDFGKVDFLVITHKHADHFDLEAIKSIIKTNKTPIILTNPEIGEIFQKEMISVKIGYIGEEFQLSDFLITLIKTDHVVKSEVIINFGVAMEVDEKKIYYTSDTRFIDLALLPKEKVTEPDILCIPISDRGVVMGIDDALYFTNEIKPKIVIPMHYDSPKDKERIRTQHFIERFNFFKTYLSSLNNVNVKVLSFGSDFEI